VPKDLFRQRSKCGGTVEDHRNIALGVRELTAQLIGAWWLVDLLGPVESTSLGLRMRAVEAETGLPPFRLVFESHDELVAVDAARVTRTRPGNLDGEDLALRCQAGMYNSVGPAELAAAFSLCDRALNIDNGNSSRVHSPLTRISTLLTSPKPMSSWDKTAPKRRSSRGSAASLSTPVLSMPTSRYARQTTSWSDRTVPWNLLTRRFASVRATRSCASYII
jgi:hypothetical protein